MSCKPWHLAPVPPDLWWQFSALSCMDGVDMLTRSDLIDHDEGAGVFSCLQNRHATYPVVLRCDHCRTVQRFVADPFDDAGLEDRYLQLEGLDHRMEPWLEKHRPCRYQLALWPGVSQ